MCVCVSEEVRTESPGAVSHHTWVLRTDLCPLEEPHVFLPTEPSLEPLLVVIK